MGGGGGARMGPIAGTEAAEQLSRGPGYRGRGVGKPSGYNVQARSMERVRWA